jgi:hypothetical protein
LVFAIISKISSVETLLNNLQEADFNLADVSVILGDEKLRNKIADDAGPLKGTAPLRLVSRLTQLGLSGPDAGAYADAVAKGQALVAMNVSKSLEKPSLEMLNDYDPQLVKVIS